MADLDMSTSARPAARIRGAHRLRRDPTGGQRQLKSNLPQAAALLHRHTCCEESLDGRIGQCSIPIVSPFAILAQEVTAF
ncbi:MAG: hypothetical protein E5X23_30510 [Mesorhizobium sp.]|uniref:hypothetical protein n=1 Tax=unclassified Mesorhizobium TaxID=325217 RepID=UPI000FCB1D56|nr:MULTISPECIES: hypothetical protein [unclassified Mesorhizobium]MCT2581478.1 hypothetical protein [Mesorhizobium sp. P13.3]MDF3169729.1 hypothetical protein [Mesorhizobium sp. P16.1]MDF3181458.1 hypothetical protein [Mesorhizobium sp. P17.1]MDF3186643.1 hypothetical protein [Mesorhizobium sp. ICCV3110.1]RUV65273.1 hypothetical protein EOA64_03175 [Mesorhizobium sp. M1A.F.Ca.IN.022.02.1.1]